MSLPTDGGTGSLVSDFNFDGHPDIFFFCHRSDGSPEKVGDYGDHATVSRLFWGGAAGFSAANRLEIPSIGAHYDVGIDLGDIAGRRLEWSFASAPRESPGTQWRTLTWDAHTPGRTAVRFQVRTAGDRKSLDRAEWVGQAGSGTFFTDSGSSVRTIKQERWIQYRAILDTANGAASPVLSAVQIDFE